MLSRYVVNMRGDGWDQPMFSLSRMVRRVQGTRNSCARIPKNTPAFVELLKLYNLLARLVVEMFVV